MEKINMSLQGIFSEEKSYICQKKIEGSGVGGKECKNGDKQRFSPNFLWG